MTRTKKKQEQPQTTDVKLRAIIKSCRNILRDDKGSGMDTDLGRLPLLTWVMFLKFMDDLEKEDEIKMTLARKSYKPLIEKPYRWRDWAEDPKGITGDDLLRFLNNDEFQFPDGNKASGLFAYLRGLKAKSSGSDRRAVIGRVFEGLGNCPMRSGYLLRDVINKVGQINFNAKEDLFVLGTLYETMLKEMRDAAGQNGEFYTPRAVVKFMVAVTDPRLGETVLDPACGTGGFLSETFEHLKGQARTVSDWEQLQHHSLFGGEAKPLAYLLCEMNLLLHGVENPNIDPGNSLRHRLVDITDKDRVDVIVTNPPFGGAEETGIQNNFPDDKRTAETALLFLQLIMRKLRRRGTGPNKSEHGGRAAVIVPNGALFSDGVCARIKYELLRDFNLHTIVRLPTGVFSPYTNIPTNILFFNRKGPTEEVWFYEHPLPEGRKNYTKTKPIQPEEFEPLKQWWENREENEHAWKLKASDLIEKGENGSIVINLDRKNPNSQEALEHLPPEELVADIIAYERQVLGIMKEIQQVLEGRS
jgi:type I restriction enzyme M protein